MPDVVMASFSEAFEQLNESNKKSALTKEEIIKKILQYYLSHAEDLKKLKDSLGNLKKNRRDPWEDDDDEENLKEYLKAETRANLKEKYEALVLKSTSRRTNNFPIELDGALGFFKPIISFMFLLFSAGNCGLIGVMSRFLHDKEVAKNPTIDLNEEEKNNSEYSHLFASAAKENKQYNAVYREITKIAESKEQVLNGMLRYVNNSLKSKNQAAEAKKRLEEVESVLLGGRNFTDEAGKRYLCDMVNKNLDAALRKMSIDVTVPLDAANLEKVEKIQTVKNTFAKLFDKVAERQRQLEEDPLTKSKIEEFNIFINEHKRKLLHFVIKSQAFAKGETLKPGVDLKDKYKEEDSYFDCWLSKVPSAANTFEQHGRIDKMIFRQFMRKPADEAALGSCEDLVDIDAYKAAQKKVQDDRIKEFREQVKSSCLLVNQLRKESLLAKKQADSFSNKKLELSVELSDLDSDPNATPEEKRSKQKEIERYKEKVDLFSQKRIELDNQVTCMQENIIANAIDITMVEQELTSYRENADPRVVNFNWRIAGREANLILELEKALQTCGINPTRQELARYIAGRQSASPQINAQEVRSPQTVSELFSILQEQSNSLLQQTNRASASLETPGERANAGLPVGTVAQHQALRPQLA